ncbi:Peroxidase 16 [Hibiscus syriacus]|uniref:Peroxidase n=1 Tax=Hibiscus syriacus TaxID=106335 RepID=A0A6A2YX47_HIBSY|nr:Peroxidase 16 [Hibiscus syriacus]
MANRSKIVVSLLLLLPLLFTTISAQTPKLTPNFYSTTCPNVESIVRSAVQQKFQQTFGCDASVLLASANGKAEKDHPDDISLAGDGFDTVIKAKAAVDSNPQCSNKVSCADILALATREVVQLTGGPFYTVELGRRDGRISTIASVQRQLPHPRFAHCGKFSKRIYNFSPRSPVDPTLNFQYAMQLRQMCPRNVDPSIAINMDPNTPRTFDNVYYKNLQQGMGLFTSDQVLFSDPRSRNTVNLFASSNAAFNQAFVAAMTKLGRVGLTGNQGEIRRDCTRPN